MAWQQESGKDYPLLEPHLVMIPDRKATSLPCPTCRQMRRVTQPDDKRIIMEEVDDCGMCTGEVPVKECQRELLRLNVTNLAAAVAGPLRFEASKKNINPLSGSVMHVGVYKHGAVAMLVDALLTPHLEDKLLNAIYPASGHRPASILLYLELDAATIAELQERNVMTLQLPALVTPQAGGKFGMKLSISEAMAVAGNMLVRPGLSPQTETTRPGVNKNPSKQKDGYIYEGDFLASPQFDYIRWKNRDYSLSASASQVLWIIYSRMKNHGVPHVNQMEIFEEIYGGKKKLPKGEKRVWSYFRRGDANRLWNDGFIQSAGRAKFKITAKILTSTQ